MWFLLQVSVVLNDLGGKVFSLSYLLPWPPFQFSQVSNGTVSRDALRTLFPEASPEDTAEPCKDDEQRGRGAFAERGKRVSA